MRNLIRALRQQQYYAPEESREQRLPAKDADYKAWQERTKKKLLYYAMKAHKDPLKNDVLMDYIDQTSANLKVSTRERWMMNNFDTGFQYERLIKARESAHDINDEVEWRLEDPAYGVEHSKLSDLTLSVKSAFKERQRLKYPNSIDEGELEIEGEKEALGELRGAVRKAGFIIAHTTQEQPTESKPNR